MVGYKSLFKNKLKVLYGFDYETAEKKINCKNENVINKNLIEEYTKLKEKNKNNFIKNESESSPLIEVNKNIDYQIKTKCNEIKTILLKFLKETVDVAVPVAGFALKKGIKTIGFVFIPITTIVSIIWSKYNIEKDCKIYLDIFEKAFSELKFEVLEHYVNAFIEVINKLDNMGKNLVNN